MTETSKKMIIVSGVVATAVAVASILDLIAGIPFAGYSKAMDICFLIGAAILIYLCYDAWKDLR